MIHHSCLGLHAIIFFQDADNGGKQLTYAVNDICCIRIKLGYCYSWGPR